ncbi:MAG: outer membrane beta-barrel protein [Sulfuricaulis sp.]
MNFRRTILAVSLTACTGVTMAADKVPTLGEVLKVSGIDVDGYIDYSHNHLSTNTGTPSYRIFDTEHSGFNLQMLDLRVSSLPSSGIGGLVELNYGPDANVIASAGTNNTDEMDVQQAFIQYATGPFSVIAGKFVTLAGAEVIRSTDDTNYSRSFMFGYAIPFAHTGLRASYAPSDSLKFTAGINNGWDLLKQSARPSTTGNTAELGVSANPSKMFSLAAAYYNGKEQGVTGPDTRSLLDLVATVNATDALSFVLNYDNGQQDKGTATGGKAKWNGLAGYVNYTFTDQWRLSFRTEKFDDKDGFRTGTTQKLKENTLTVAYMPAKSLELRAEYRKDKSDKNVFTEGSGTKSTQNSIGLEALYKF